MLPAITSLLVLQDRDQSLRELQRDLERIPLEVARAQSRMENVQAALEKAKHALHENELAIRKLEMDVKTRRESITRLHHQRFETRKNEEYTAIGHEIENYEGQIRALEDRELELMEQAEALKAGLATAQAEHDKVKAHVNEEIAAFAKRKSHEEARLTEIQAERDNAAASLAGDPAIDLYDRLLPRKFPPVVALDQASGDTCGGCHMKLTGGTASEVKLGKKITQCDHCGRIVYLP